MKVRQCELRRMLLLQEYQKCLLGRDAAGKRHGEECILFLFQLFAEMSITFVAVYPSYISGRCESYGLKKIQAGRRTD
jgi:hypothetical protein